MGPGCCATSQATGNEVPDPIASFEDVDLGPALLSNVRRCKYNKPTPVQRYSIPIGLAGRDLMACAQVGAGLVGGAAAVCVGEGAGGGGGDGATSWGVEVAWGGTLRWYPTGGDAVSAAAPPPGGGTGLRRAAGACCLVRHLADVAGARQRPPPQTFLSRGVLRLWILLSAPFTPTFASPPPPPPVLQTGSGKTAGFCFPIIAGALQAGFQAGPRGRKAFPLALVLSPTRELSSQIYDEARKFTYQVGGNACLPGVCGGESQRGCRPRPAVCGSAQGCWRMRLQVRRASRLQSSTDSLHLQEEEEDMRR